MIRLGNPIIFKLTGMAAFYLRHQPKAFNLSKFVDLCFENFISTPDKFAYTKFEINYNFNLMYTYMSKYMERLKEYPDIDCSVQYTAMTQSKIDKYEYSIESFALRVEWFVINFLWPHGDPAYRWPTVNGPSIASINTKLYNLTKKERRIKRYYVRDHSFKDPVLVAIENNRSPNHRGINKNPSLLVRTTTLEHISLVQQTEIDRDYTSIFNLTKRLKKVEKFIEKQK